MAREFSVDASEGDYGVSNKMNAKGVENPGAPGDFHGTKGPKKGRKPASPVKAISKGKQGGRISG